MCWTVLTMSQTSMARMLVILPAIILAGCSSTHSLVKQMEINELSVERDKLLELEKWFADKQLREQQGDLIVFLSTNILDRILSRSKGLTFSVPDEDEVSLRIDSMKTEFRDGLPIVQVSASAAKPGWPGEIGLAMSALLDVDQIVLSAPDTPVGLKVLRVSPNAKYGPFNFRLRRIVETLLSVDPEIYSELLPKFTLPLEATIPVYVPGSGLTPQEASSYPDDVAELAVQYDLLRIEFPSKWSTALLIKRPPINLGVVLNVHQVLALRNGLYVFVQATAQEP